MSVQKPSEPKSYQQLTRAFLACLKAQFPVIDVSSPVGLRKASDYAGQLNVHVNYLNRAVKQSFQKTTTQVINEYFMDESKRLLISTDWKIIEIATVLGFKEGHHFSSFFKKHQGCIPFEYRVNYQRT